MPVALPETVETHAQAIAARLVARAPFEAQACAAEFVEVDVNTLKLTQPRSVGVEHVGLYALAKLQLEALLASLGINAITRAMITARSSAAWPPELSTWEWLNQSSALPELLDLSLPDL